MSLGDKFFYLGVCSGALLFVCFTFFPKRTRRTVNYLLNTWYELKQAKEAKPDEKIEVPDFETTKFPKVPDPRTSGEKKS